MARQNFLSRLNGFLLWMVGRREFRTEPLAFLWKVARWRMLTAGRREVVVTFDDGLALTSPVRNRTASSTFILGHAEPELFRFLEAFLEKGMHVCDVGANVGAYTLFAAKRVGASGRVVAVEAAPVTYEYLKNNIERSGLTNIDAHQIAVGAHSGVASLAYLPDDVGKSHVDPGARRTGRAGAAVDMIDLDTLLASSAIARLDYLKIDVEGFESQVLAGARSTLTSNRGVTIQIEILPHLQERSGYAANHLVKTLSDHGFVPHRVSNESGVKLQLLTSRDALVGDVIWVHADNRALRERLTL